jgi:hypothetical protein
LIILFFRLIHFRELGDNPGNFNISDFFYESQKPCPPAPAHAQVPISLTPTSALSYSPTLSTENGKNESIPSDDDNQKYELGFGISGGIIVLIFIVYLIRRFFWLNRFKEKQTRASITSSIPADEVSITFEDEEGSTASAIIGDDADSLSFYSESTASTQSSNPIASFGNSLNTNVHFASPSLYPIPRKPLAKIDV